MSTHRGRESSRSEREKIHNILYHKIVNCVDTQTGKNEMDDARKSEGEGMKDYQVLIKHRL